MATTSRSYGGVPVEQRRARRRAALLDAALEIIGTAGFAKLTVSRLCTEAGLSERYYYESFTDLGSVLAELFEAIVDEIGRAVVDGFLSAPDGIRLKTRAAIAAAVDLIADDPRKARLVTIEAQLNPALLQRRAEVMRSFASIMIAVCAEELGPDVVETAGEQAEFAALHLLGGLYETTNSWLAGSLPISRQDLIERSTDQFLLTAAHAIGVDAARMDLTFGQTDE